MAFAFISATKASRAIRSGRWFLASVLLHALLGAVLLCFANAYPAGTGNGLKSSGSLSLTWIPGRGDGGKGAFDSTVPSGGVEDLSVEPASVPPQKFVKQTSLIKTAEFDPQEIFQAEASLSLKADIETRIDQEPQQIRLASATETVTTTAKTRQKSTENLPPSLEPDSDLAPKRNETGASRDRSSPSGPGKGKAGGGAQGGNAGSEVGFFGIFARARRIVYVIDASESMRQHNAIGLARRELSESLRSLEPTSYFQIVFFDVTPHAMNRAKDRRGLLQATSSNLRLAEHFMKGIQPDAGTDRFAALKKAFSFDPDVIFLLTDADDPVMSDHELKEIVRLNRRRVAIHVVEYCFDGGEQEESFLQRLADQNSGEHYFCDVKEWAAASGGAQK